MVSSSIFWENRPFGRASAAIILTQFKLGAGTLLINGFRVYTGILPYIRVISISLTSPGII